jgi:hypothetical protein
MHLKLKPKFHVELGNPLHSCGIFFELELELELVLKLELELQNEILK